MNCIKQLSPQEIQKIAAGEVLERPANAVKELVENALDAQATAISIYVEDAGKQRIRVIDNGCGMTPDDARMCFAHHATSKISTVHDLQQCFTFGFRGEALSSIAAVSKVLLNTRKAAAECGTQIIIEQSEILQQESISCAVGTDIDVTNLFFNVPARKKFLKAKETELRQITLLFQAFCLDYPNVHFRLHSDRVQTFNCPPVTSLQDRTMQLWDQKLAGHMIEIEATDTKTKSELSGIITSHQYFRYDRSCIFFFINKRWVKSHQLQKALLKGYLNVLPPERYPAAFLFLTVDPAQLDINIHPRKEEVHIAHARSLELLF